MMFGEQHLVRFGNMTKPAGVNPPPDTQDAPDPQQVTYTLAASPSRHTVSRIKNSDRVLASQACIFVFCTARFVNS